MSSAVSSSSKPPSTHIDKKSKSNTSISAAEAPSRKLRRAFRSFASALIVAARQAEKKVDGNDESKPSSKDDNKSSDKTKVEEKDPLQSSVETILKLRQTLRTTATKLEDKLRGNVIESEALQCCLSSKPCVVGGRKRKFAYLDKSS